MPPSTAATSTSPCPTADAASAVAGYADLVLVVGPAGTGKTTALARPSRNSDRAAPCSACSVGDRPDVFSQETGDAADTIHKLLVDQPTAGRPTTVPARTRDAP